MSTIELRQHTALARLSSPRQLDVHAKVEKAWQDDAKGVSILADLFAATAERRPNAAAVALEIVQALREGDEPKAIALLFSAIDDAHTAAAIEEVEDEECEAMLAERDFDPDPYFPTPRLSASHFPPEGQSAGAASLTFPAGTGKTDAGHAAGGAFPFGAAA